MRAFKNRLSGKSALGVLGTNQVSHNNIVVIVAALLPLAIMMLSYWPTIKILFDDWQNNDDYSAGQLVPIVALFLLWRERKTIRDYPFVPCWSGGIFLVLFAQTTRFYGFLSGRYVVERYSLVFTVAGLVLLIAGWKVLNAVKWILLFLFLMFPLPGVIHNRISGPLQRIATSGSVFLLEAFGATVSRQGNVIMLNDTTPMAVAEACSGLRMLTAFVIVAAFMAYMVKRSRFKKAVLLFSSIPVAVMCNIIRLFVTGVLFMVASSEVAEKFFHDFAGLAMMPIAVLIMFAELWLLDKIIEREPTTVPKSQHNIKKKRMGQIGKLEEMGNG